MPSALARRLGFRHPIVLAPMAGGPTTPELVAAACEEGAFGFLAVAYLGPEQIAQTIARTRALTSAPFGVNLFAGGWSTAPAPDAAAALELVGEAHRALGLAPPVAPAPSPDPYPAQLEAVLAARPAALGFTFGMPSSEELASARAAGILTMGTATTTEEAAALAAAGVDAVMAQGAEAGGHRGTFRSPFDAGLVPTLDLVAACARSVSVPIVAAGGLMDGRDLAAALACGADAGALGTAFLACPESGASPAYKQAIQAARGDPTVVTRAFSGRPARGLRNAFIERAEARPGAILPYPLQNTLTRGMRTAAAKAGRAEFLSLWAGQGVARTRALPARELVRALAAELDAT
jgi:nitronate monooxygenase